MTPIPALSIPTLDSEAERLARARQNTLTKPPGSLGRLEEIACRMAAIQGAPSPRADRRWVVVAAADHGVAAEGVSAYPSEVTAQMVRNFLDGGAAISVLARAVEARVVIVDAGVAGDIPGDLSDLRRISIGPGTASFTRGPAMPRPYAEAAVEAGIDLATDLAGQGADIIATGEMGIGNSTSAAAITSVMTGRPAAEVTGRGTGVDDEGVSRKIAAIERGLDVNRPDPADPLGVLAAVGGYEIGLLAGLMLGAASQRVAIAMDGFISTAAALIAHGLQPRVAGYTFACTLSAERGHTIALEELGQEPILDLGLRLGEGTGATLALSVIGAAVSLHNEMATFKAAHVSGPAESPQERIPSGEPPP